MSLTRQTSILFFRDCHAMWIFILRLKALTMHNLLKPSFLRCYPLKGVKILAKIIINSFLPKFWIFFSFIHRNEIWDMSPLTLFVFWKTFKLNAVRGFDDITIISTITVCLEHAPLARLIISIPMKDEIKMYLWLTLTDNSNFQGRVSEIILTFDSREFDLSRVVGY